MHITILTAGTQGDVQPYVALGMGLIAAGHRVTLVTSDRFAPLATRYGLGHRSLPVDFLDLVQTPEGQKALSGGNKLNLMKRIMPLLRQMIDAAWEATADSEAVLYHPKALAGYHIAEARRIPGILTHPLPLASPTGAFPSVVLPLPSLGPVLNRLSHRLFLWASLAPYRKLVARWRESVLGLPGTWNEWERDGRPIPRLYGYSPQLLPIPHDWDDSTCVSGAWFLDGHADWQPPADLAAFLAAGPPPVYVGFGSMAGGDSQHKTAIVIESLARAGLRGVMASGAGGLAMRDTPSHVHMLDAVPHDWLFPRVAAVVHHGGAGTTAAGLRAGKPTLICPFFGDQPFWGKRVAALGVGVPPIPQRRLSGDRLADALTRLTHDTALRDNAQALGARIKDEDGVGRAVTWIESVLGGAAAASGRPRSGRPGDGV
jgi:sterol 3beta-glucosyltransferase